MQLTRRRVLSRALAGLLAAGLAAGGASLAPARSATPDQGTIGPDTPELRWQGGPIPAQTAGFGGVGCTLGDLDPTCDGFTLTIEDLTPPPAPTQGRKSPKKGTAPAPVLDDVRISIAGKSTPGRIAEFDLYVYDAAGREVARSTNLGNDAVVLDQPAPGDYRVYVQNVLSIDTEATYDAAAQLHDSSSDPIDIEPTPCGLDEPTGLGTIVGDPTVVTDGIDRGQTISLDVALVLDGITEAAAQTIISKAAESYAPLKVALTTHSVRFESFLDENGMPVTDGLAIIRMAKQRLGGERPAGSDLVAVMTSQNIQQLGQAAVAGIADCIGGVAHPDRAFFVAEATPSGDIAIGPAVFQVNATANVFAHEAGHLMGGQHHYANCVEGVQASDVRADGTVEGSPCTLMFNAADFLGPNFGVFNGSVTRGSAFRYARP